jgi:SAM-dependent methyltransferase
LTRGYQYEYSNIEGKMLDVEGRRRKANTMVAVLRDACDRPLQELSLLNVGGSAGIIDDVLAGHFLRIDSVDIDEPAIARARKNFVRDNLFFAVGDAMNLQFDDHHFDVAICSHVYEHVPDASKLMAELERVLKPGGICYFAAGNRFAWLEPHYHLPLLSAIPRPLAHLYMRLAGKGDYYYERHLSYWGLRALTRGFEVEDYTGKIVEDPERFGADYMLEPGSMKAALAKLITRHLTWIVPSYVWLLKTSARAR